MAFDEIKKVAEAEAAQKSAKEAAVVASKDSILKAQSEAKTMVEKARAEATGQVRQMVAAAEKEAETKNHGILSNAQNQCAAQKQTAQNKLGDAVKLITERVVNSQWQS